MDISQQSALILLSSTLIPKQWRWPQAHGQEEFVLFALRRVANTHG